MGWTDTITKAIVGTGEPACCLTDGDECPLTLILTELADKHEQANLEKICPFKHLSRETIPWEQNSRDYRKMSRETAPLSLGRKFSSVRRTGSALLTSSTDEYGTCSPRTVSNMAEPPSDGTLRARPLLQRSQSDFEEGPKEKSIWPSGPPDLTAVDLSPAQLQRAYSDVWDRKKSKLPPLGAMAGFGDYRHSKNATPEWHAKQLQRRLGDLPTIVGRLGDFRLAQPDPETWANFQEESARRQSFASTKTSTTTSSDDPPEGIIDPLTGTLIQRGFAPSTTTSAASSYKESTSSHLRKDSGLATTSIGFEAGDRLSRYPRAQSTVSLLSEPRTLDAIDEDPTGDYRQKAKAKRSQTLEMIGDNDDGNACLTDEEYEDASEPVSDRKKAMQMLKGGTSNRRRSTQGRLEQKNKIERAETLDTELDKVRIAAGVDGSKTIVMRSKPVLRRAQSQSRHQTAKLTNKSTGEVKKMHSDQPNRTKSHDQTSFTLPSSDESADAMPLSKDHTRMLPSSKESAETSPTSEDSGEAEDQPQPLAWFAPKEQQKSSERSKDDEDGGPPLTSESTVKSVTEEQLARNFIESPTSQQRRRAETMIHRIAGQAEPRTDGLAKASERTKERVTH